MSEDKDFKVGDTVLYEGWDMRAIAKVSKITPKGGIRINRKEDILFRPDGTYQQSGKWGIGNFATIKKITPEEEKELLQEFKKSHIVRECKNALNALLKDNTKLSYEASVKILDILKEEGVINDDKGN